MKKIIFFKRTIFWLTLFMFYISVFPVLGYSKSDPEFESKIVLAKIEKIKASGKLVVGTSADYPPYEFHLLNDKEQDIVGLDIDIAHEIAKELGVKLVLKNIVFHNLFPALNSDQVDIVASGLCPSARWRKIVDFSENYYQAIQNILIRCEDAEKIFCIKDLRGKKVGTRKDSIQEEIVKREILGAEFIVRETIDELIADLKSGQIDAVILEKTVAESIFHRNKDLKNIVCRPGAFDSPLVAAIAVKKGNDDLLKEINRIIKKLKQENKIVYYIENTKILMNKW